MTTPYSSAEDLVADQIDACALLVEQAATRTDDGIAIASRLALVDDAIDARIRAGIRTGQPPIATWLRTRLGLTPTEERVVWLLVACELSPVVRTNLRSLATEVAADPTTDAIRRVVYGDAPSIIAWRELAGEGSLQRWGLVERTDEARGDISLARRTLRVNPRVVSLLLGDDDLDPGLSPMIRFGSPGELDQIAVSDECRRVVTRALERPDPGVIIAVGPRSSGRRSLLVAAADVSGRSVIEIDCSMLAGEDAAATRQLRAIARECVLFDRSPMLRELDRASEATQTLVDRNLVPAVRGPIFATSSRTLALRWSRPVVVATLGAITEAKRMELWGRAVPEAPPDAVTTLARRFPIAPGLISRAANAARAGTPSTLGLSTIGGGVRSVLEDRLAGLADRVAVKQTWDDLVLPDDQLAQITDLVARVKHRATVLDDWGFGDKVGTGTGISALFSGPPGTGKTMVAGLIARTLGLDLYRVDLARIVSKWIGETEKNLAAVFDAAETGAAILLFDEADSLFGKRTQVMSSNDRYANLEVNFLLQRIESFTGICILTTNHETAVDEAFKRRLSLHVRLPMPEADERERLWHAMLPTRAPVDANLDLRTLAAKFEMSGGHIKNAVLRAAYRAADEGTSIGHAHLLNAAHTEYECIGKIAPRGLSLAG